MGLVSLTFPILEYKNRANEDKKVALYMAFEISFTKLHYTYIHELRPSQNDTPYER